MLHSNHFIRLKLTPKYPKVWSWSELFKCRNSSCPFKNVVTFKGLISQKETASIFYKSRWKKKLHYCRNKIFVENHNNLSQMDVIICKWITPTLIRKEFICLKKMDENKIKKEKERTGKLKAKSFFFLRLQQVTHHP